MKIAAAQIESFVKSPTARLILVYGPDAGLVSERAKAMAKTVVADLSDPFRVADLSFDSIKEDPSILAAEMQAISMIGGQRLVRVSTNSSALPKGLAEVLEKTHAEAMVIFTADDLPPTSALRKFFEKENHAAAIPCYKDDNRAIQGVISGRLTQNGYRYDADVIAYLAGSFSGDRMVILSEVEKLITYMGQVKHITLADVRACVFDSSEFSLDELCNAFASRNTADTDKHVTKALSEGISPVVIIRTILRYFLRLQEVHNSIAGGANEQQAVSALRPPIFFKQLPLFKRHLTLWKPADISRVIARFIELEIDCKTTGNPAELLCARLLTIMPLMLRNAARK